MKRHCYRCAAEIRESMGAVLARDILSESPQQIRELCGTCVGRLCYENDEPIEFEEPR